VENTLDRFAIGDVIGKGSYASVRLARDKLTGRYSFKLTFLQVGSYKNLR
jgi:hypothetical protein